MAMKIFKYATALLAMIAMTASFSSCSKDVDERKSKDIEAKENFWMEVSVSNPGSLNDAVIIITEWIKVSGKTYEVEKARYSGTEYFNLTFNKEIYGTENKIDALICNPIHNTSNYAWNNWNKLLALSDADNDIIQKVMIPVAKAAKVRDFEVTVTFSKDEKQSVLGTKVYKAADFVSAEDIAD